MSVWLLLGLGLVILLLAGDALVRGAVNTSLRLGVPALIVSLTVIAFGTSAPELLVSFNAVLKGEAGLALGNVIGSNTANILLVLGVPAIISGLHVSQCDSRRNYVMMICVSLLFIALAFRGGFDLLAAIILLGFLAYVLGDMFVATRSHRRALAALEDDPDDLAAVEGADSDMPWWQITAFLVLDLVGLPLGAELLVDNATIIAHHYGVSDSVIGLTLVAVGTSLPELATTVMAAIRRQADVALGNVIGSNIFNLLAIIGITSLVAPIPVDPEFLQFDLWVMLAASLLLGPFVLMCRDIGRLWGVTLTACYMFYVLLVLD